MEFDLSDIGAKLLAARRGSGNHNRGRMGGVGNPVGGGKNRNRIG